MMPAAALGQPFAGSLVLAPCEPAPLILLNPAARLIWEGLRNGLPRAEVEARVAAACGIGEAAARAQVVALEAEWRRAGLLAGSPGPETTSAATEPELTAPGNDLVQGGSRLVYALCGEPIAVHFVPPKLEELVAARFGHARTRARPIANLTLARRGEDYVLQTSDGTSYHATCDGLLGAFVRRYVELSYPGRDWLAVLHSAAVVGGSGNAVLLPGPNGAGKSTLVAALLAAGYRYLSDDCVPIASDGRVVPVPFALCVKRTSWAITAPLLPTFAASAPLTWPGGRRYVPVRRLVHDPCHPARIVFPRYAEGAPLRVDPLNPVETLARLVAGRAWIARDSERLRAALDLLERLPSHSLTYGRTIDAVEALAAMERPFEPGASA